MMEAPRTLVRPAAPDDFPALAALMSQLGYPATPDAMRTRMRRIEASPDHATFVAEVEGTVIGMAGAMVGAAYHQDEPFARLLALVVDSANRGRGAGAALVRAAEGWARARGAVSLHLTTGRQREEAHRFYARLGYEDTGKRLFKRLDR
jgi:GNAT superfamily N-acetyltransferase